ncbi:MAG TPA: Ig-like domain-containing protein, partial [Gemmatimonadales bacterium]|nr:Ig-like domain-containing protein [Gemmatimonadales bacterium]
MIRSPRSTRFFAFVLCGVSACSGADLVLPDEGEPAAVAVIQGNEQAGRAGETLSQPVIALVSDARGRPVADVELALVLDGGGSAEPPSARSGTDGTAAFQVVLGTAIGSVAGRVEVVAAEGEPALTTPVTFTALSADAAGIVLLSGDGQSAPVSTTLPQPLVVQVADVFGNPIAGVPVSWTAEGGGSVSEATVPTDADGRSQVTRTLGSAAGTQLTLASAEGLAGSPVTFTATATPGSAASLQAVSGDGQSAIAGSALADPLVVRLLDPEGNPVEGTAVAWVVGQGGGAVAPETAPTGPDGLASTQWTLGGLLGTQSVTAVVSGV